MESKIKQILKNLEVGGNKNLDGVLENTEKLKTYRLFEFVKAVLNEQSVDSRILAELIATYDPKKHVAEIRGRTINVDKGSLAVALNLPETDVTVPVDEDYLPAVDLNEVEYASFLHSFVLTFMYLNPGTKVAGKLHQMRRCIMNGHPKLFDFSGFMWLLVEDELLQGSDLKKCYYSRHMQCLIRSQHKDLFLNPVDDDDGYAQMDDDVGEKTGDDVGQTGEVSPRGDDVGPTVEGDAAGPTRDGDAAGLTREGDDGGSDKGKPTAPEESQTSLEYREPESSSKKRMADTPKNKQPSKKRKPPAPKKKPSAPEEPQVSLEHRASIEKRLLDSPEKTQPLMKMKPHAPPALKPSAPEKSQGSLEYGAPESSSEKMIVDSPEKKQPLKKRTPRKRI